MLITQYVVCKVTQCLAFIFTTLLWHSQSMYVYNTYNQLMMGLFLPQPKASNQEATCSSGNVLLVNLTASGWWLMCQRPSNYVLSQFSSLNCFVGFINFYAKINGLFFLQINVCNKLNAQTLVFSFTVINSKVIFDQLHNKYLGGRGCKLV